MIAVLIGLIILIAAIVGLFLFALAIAADIDRKAEAREPVPDDEELPADLYDDGPPDHGPDHPYDWAEDGL